MLYATIFSYTITRLLGTLHLAKKETQDLPIKICYSLSSFKKKSTINFKIPMLSAIIFSYVDNQAARNTTFTPQKKLSFTKKEDVVF